jgi:methionyl-tRNA formyltransferase
VTDNFIIATIKDWNVEQYRKAAPMLTGNWSLLTKPSQLTIEHLRKLKPRYIFFPHWSWLVPEDIINEFTCICFHMSDVPYGRGGSPLQNLISRGHTETKLSALRMTKQLDSGDVYLKAPLSLEGSAQQIFERCAELTFEMIASIVNLAPIPIAQHGEVTTFTRRRPEQSEIKGNETITELYDLIRMMDAESYPKAYIHHHDIKLTFERAHLSDDNLIASVTISRDKE